MSIFGALPGWAIVLLALLAGAVLVGLNSGWLLAARAMLEGYRRKDGSTSDAAAGDRGKPPDARRREIDIETSSPEHTSIR
jgi:hypothetical protein